jgi:hypothetical protein
MKVNVYALPRDPNWTFTEVQYLYYRYIRKYAPPGIEIVLKHRDEEKEARGFGDCKYGGCKFGPLYLVIENDENKKYILISYWDRLSDVLVNLDGPARTHFDPENCVEILTSAGVHDPKVAGMPYTPFTFVTTSRRVEWQIEKMYRSKVIKTIPEKLKFKGFLYDFREHLSLDDRFDVRNKDKYAEEYIEELATERISLGLHGAGETCPRDMEMLGLGNVMVRKNIVANYHNPLIPDVHYAGVEWKDIPYDMYYQRDDYWKELANRYYDKFQQIKNDEEYLNYVSQNARQWYVENGTIKANVRLMCKLVDFNKLV